jgi:hypothetical protein
MNSREIVRRAIEFDDPPRIPYYFMFNPPAADIVVIGPLDAASSGAGATRGLKPGETYVDKWGVTWEATGRFWDHAIGHPLADLRQLASFRPPDPMTSLGPVKPFAWLARRLGKYVAGFNPVGMYETARSLMGFEGLMLAPYDQPDGLLKLLELLTGMTIDVVETYAAMGTVDALFTAEDWGLQTSLQMNIDTFREFYKPFYQRIVDACHRRGMHFIWHNCGYIVDQFPDMIELGVDVVQLDQPRLMGHQALIEALGGKVCMWNTVDIQWATSEGVSDEDIHQEVADMVRTYDVVGHGGGYIAKHYPQPWDIELPPERQRLIYDAFMQNGCRALPA